MNEVESPDTVAPFKWTPENTKRFWSKVRQTPLGLSDFSVTAGARLPKMMAEFIPTSGAKVLDFGSGGATLPSALSDMGYEVTGYDPSLSDEDIQHYPSKPRLCNSYPSEEFDAIIVSEVIEHLLDDEVEACFQQWYESLPIGGRLIITTPYQENLQTSLCLCPACDTTFHRWQHQRSVSFRWLANYLSEDTGWKRVHNGRYDFSSEVEFVTAVKRYQRYRASMVDKIQVMIDSANSDESADLASKITEGIDTLLFSGYLTDPGLDHSEGLGNILVCVVEKIERA